MTYVLYGDKNDGMGVLHNVAFPQEWADQECYA